MIRLLAVFNFVFAFHAAALANNWYDRGNGGFALYCPNQAPIVLDLHEINSRQLGVAVLSSANTAVDKAVDLASRLKDLDPTRARHYMDSAKSFVADAQFSTGISIQPTPDLGFVSIPEGCKLEQVVFQRNPSLLNKTRYVVNSTLWNTLNTDNQAALILHEVIYQEFMNSPANEPSSERVRVFNGLIHTLNQLPTSKADYLRLLQDLHLTTYEENGLKISLGYSSTEGRWIESAVYLDEKNQIASAALSANQYFRKGRMEYACAGSAAPELGRAQFENGKIRSLKVADDFSSGHCLMPFMILPESDDFSIRGHLWIFDQEENVNQVESVLSQRTRLLYKGREYELIPDLFNPQTYLSTFTFDGMMNLTQLSLGGTACLKNETRVQFNSSPALGNDFVSIRADGTLLPLPLCK